MNLCVQAQQIEPIWCQFEDTDGSSYGYTPRIIIDSFNNVIALGGVYAPGPATGFITIKYDSTGNKLWERRHQTIATDFITAAATDSEGSIYVGGVTINNPLGGAGNQVVFKYAANGDTLWQYYLKVYQGVSTSISNLLLDRDENLLIFGGYFDTLQNRSGLYIQKKAADGAILWTATHVEDDFGYGSSNSIWTGDRWVFWGRNGSSANGGTRLLCWQVGADGQTLATAASSLNPEIIFPLHIDREGSLYLTRGNEYKVVKYAVSAEKEWTFLKPATTFPQFTVAARMEALTTDTSLNVYMSGFIRIDSIKIEPTTIKLNDSGTLLWEDELFTHFGAKIIYPWQTTIISEDRILVSGNLVTNVDSNFYEPFFVLYKPTGYIQGAFSNLNGRLNDLGHVIVDKTNLFAIGISSAEEIQEDDSQFLCKYDLHDLLSTKTIEPNFGIVNRLTLHPNPFSDHCTIILDLKGKSGSGELTLSDTKGTIVFQQEIFISEGVQSIELPACKNLPNGMYNLLILTEDGGYHAKAVKIR
jgi:hypothetical protein